MGKITQKVRMGNKTENRRRKKVFFSHLFPNFTLKSKFMIDIRNFGILSPIGYTESPIRDILGIEDI